MSRAATARKKGNKQASWALRILLLAVAAFVVVHIFQTGKQLADVYNKVQESHDLEYSQGLINEAYDAQLNDAVELCEQEANENGMYHSGQQIYRRAEG